MLLYHAGMVSVGLALGGASQVRSLGRGAQLLPLGLLGILCLASGPALYLTYPFFTGGDQPLGPVLGRLGLSGAPWLAFMVYYTLVNPFIEEWYWRGVLGSESRLPVASDVAFAGYHAVVLVAFIPAYWAALTAASLTGAAWLWRQLAARAGGLLVPVATHLLADLSVIVAAWAIATRLR
jgi:membrane protease YdiL (CAAX protease family)